MYHTENTSIIELIMAVNYWRLKQINPNDLQEFKEEIKQELLEEAKTLFNLKTAEQQKTEKLKFEELLKL